jgi:hypothetical protein
VQTLTTPQDSSAQFGNVRIDNAAGVQIGADLFIRGQLMSGGGTLRGTPGSGRTAFVRGGLNVAALTLDGVLLDVSGGALTRFDNVTFQNASGPALLKIRHAGTSDVFTMNNISFLMAPVEGQYWIDATDTDANTGALTIDVVSQQASSGAASTQVSGGAVVTWRLPQGSGGQQP